MSNREAAEKRDERQARMLRIHLLGPPRVTWNGDELRIPRRQARALLYRLAAQSEPLPRGHLSFLFWPDTPDATARTNLSRLLNLLRNALPDLHLVESLAGRIGLASGRVWVDVRAWDETAASSLETMSAAELRRLTELYGGPFLGGFSLPGRPEFENWVTRERERRERLYLEALSALVEREAAQGEYDQAILHARRYLEVDDLSEEMHRRLIRLYAATGDRKAASRQFERCVAVLERELGVSPLPETRAVYEAAMAGVVASPSPTERPPWTVLPSLDAPFVGREEALSRLQRASLLARAGRGQAVLISGEPGIGKTRLLQEFAAQAPPDTLLLTAGGHEAEKGLPYWPLAEALRPLSRALSQGMAKVAPFVLAEVARLLPELRSLLPKLPPVQEEPGQERARLLRAFSELLLHLASDRPLLLLCLDDLQWVDEATLSWLGYLGRRLRDARVLVVGAYRRGDADAVEGLRREWRRLGILDEMCLSGLREPEVVHLAQHLAGGHPDVETLGQRLHRETGGNPFFILEVLRALAESGAFSPDAPVSAPILSEMEELPIPDSVSQVLQVRLRRLTPRDRQVLEAGAVLGQRAGPEPLVLTSGRSEEEVVEALGALVEHRLLLEHDGTYEFAHDLIRTAVCRGLSHGRRRLLHRRAARALEALHSDDVVALARHFEMAGDFRKAVFYLLQAGDRARSLYAYREAVRHYERALELQAGQGDEEAAARTWMRLGLTYHIAFDFEKARQAHERGFDLWQKAMARQPTDLHPPAPHPLRVDWPNLMTLDPALAADGNSGGVIDQLFSGLVEWSPTMNVVPDVAHSWEVLDEGRRYVFHLREDRVWGDGRPVTADDFVYAWRRALHPKRKAPSADLLFAIEGARAYHAGELDDPGRVGVRALDERTLLVELDEPCSYFLHILAHMVARPLPREVVEAHGDEWTKPGVLVTNGPFRLRAWEPGQKVVLERSLDYHGRTIGNVDRVELYLRVTPEAKAAKLRMYEEDRLDVLGLRWGIPLPRLLQILREHGGEYTAAPGLFVRYLGFDVTRPPFDDARVRRSFAHAMDRVALVNGVMGGLSNPALGGFVPPGMPGHSPDIGLSHVPRRARSLLDDVGYPSGTGFPQVELQVIPGAEAVGSYLADRWQRILGVDVEPRPTPWAEYMARLDSAQRPHMFLGAWVADYPDPDSFLRASNFQRLTGWRHREFEALVEKARRIQDQDERMRMYRRADGILMEESPLIPLTYARRNLLLKPWVRTFPVSPIGWWFWKDVILAPH